MTSFKLGARILQYEGGTNLSECRGTHPLMSNESSNGYWISEMGQKAS